MYTFLETFIMENLMCNVEHQMYIYISDKGLSVVVVIIILFSPFLKLIVVIVTTMQ